MFAIGAAESFERVEGVDINSSAIELAQANARINGLGHLRFLVGEADAIFSKVDFSGSECAVVIDPPRTGCSPEFLEQLVAFAPRRIVYVACDPSTQARDACILGKKGYRVIRIQPFDFFPQTRHIENVAVLESSQ